MKDTLKSGKFWAGVVAGVALIVFFPQINPRAIMGKPKGA